MDYKEQAAYLKRRSKRQFEDADEDAMYQAAQSITELIQYKDAIDRMGEFGKLFLQYSGCPRGMIGEAGYVEAGDVVERAKESVMHYETITDVDGNAWRPVLEDRLQSLIRHMTERAEAADTRAERAEMAISSLLGISPQERITTCFGHPLERVMDLVKADREERCVVLPCKIGTPVYVIQWHIGCAAMDDESYKFVDDFPRPFRIDMLSEFGKTVFPTREAAEKEILERTRRMLGRKEE